jgi:hypothetical protein
MKNILLIFLLIGGDLNAQHINHSVSKNTLWDFFGIWHYGEKSESLNIAKDLSSKKITIVYNSKSDGYQDRFFDNCHFKNGVIYGDFWGGKENVKIEIDQEKLLLTINPFHQFTPIVKQHFKRYPSAIFKYTNSQNNSYVLDGKKKVDSIPPGDRIFVDNQTEIMKEVSIRYYLNRFRNNSQIDNASKNILSTQLSNIKPLFIAENCSIQFYSAINEAEEMIKKLYKSEKLKENTVIVKYPEQNIVGQKKNYCRQNDLFSLKPSINQKPL